MAFGLEFFDVAPGLRVSGDSLAFIYKFTKQGGEASGTKGLEVGLTDDPTIKLLEAENVSGYDYQPNTDGVYQALVVGGLTELVGGLAVGIDSLSSIETSDAEVKLGIAGGQPALRFRPGRVPAVTKIGDSGYLWELPSATFVDLKAAAETYQSELKTKIEQMVAQRVAADANLAADVADEVLNRVNADGLLTQAIDAQAVTDADARAVLSGRIDALEADPTTAAAVAAVQADVDTNEADSDAAEAALSGRLDVLEADPTTATAVAAGDAATLSSANSYTDVAVAAVQADVDQNEADGDAADSALSGRLDVLEADPTTATAVAAVQSNLDTEAGTRASADSALDGRLDVLEADPTTATALTDGLALKADLAGATFTGDVVVDEGSGSTIKLETTDATSAGIHIEGPTGSMGYIDTTNGFGNDSLQVYSANFWVRAINNGTGNVIIDGNISAPNLPGPYTNDGDAATNGVAVGSLYYDGNGHVRFRVS